jgi:hypothetical protein
LAGSFTFADMGGVLSRLGAAQLDRDGRLPRRRGPRQLDGDRQGLRGRDDVRVGQNDPDLRGGAGCGAAGEEAREAVPSKALGLHVR